MGESEGWRGKCGEEGVVREAWTRDNGVRRGCSGRGAVFDSCRTQVSAAAAEDRCGRLDWLD